MVKDIAVDRDDQSTKFWLAPVALARNLGFAAVELRRVQRLVAKHEPRLLEASYEYFGGSAASAIRHPAPRRARSARLHGDWSMSWQRPFKELNPKVEELIVKVLEEGKGAGQSPEWQTLGSVTQLDCHNPLCQRGGVDLHHTLREMVATRRAELENVKMCRGIEGGGSSAAPRHCLNRFTFRISLAYTAEGDR